MALCEAQLDSAVPQLKEEEATVSQTIGHEAETEVGQLNMPLGVDYTSPRSHFIPPEVEMYSLQNRRLNSSQSGSTTSLSTIGSNTSGVPAKRKRGRPRIDKTSPEYLAKSEERRQAREMAAMMNSSGEIVGKKKRGRPRIDKTSPEYLARKHAKELEALEKKAQRQYKRRGTGDSAASSSAGEGTSRVKRKYTKRAMTGDTPAKRGRKRKVVLGPDGLPITPPLTEKVKGKRGRPRKDASGTPNSSPNKPLIRVRSNLMPDNTEPIPVDSDDEGELGSPGNSESLSFDDNLRALRHLHEKYANIGKDESYSAHLLSANVQTTPTSEQVVPVSSDSSGSSSSGSSSSDSSSSSSSSGSSSDSSDSEPEVPTVNGNQHVDKDGDDSEPDIPVSNGTLNIQESGEDRLDTLWLNLSLVTLTRDYISTLERQNYLSDIDPTLHQSRSPTPPWSRDFRAASLSESENESPDKSVQCNVCRKWFSTIVTLKIHRRVHMSRAANSGNSRAGRDRYECDCCASVFSRRERLLEHKATVHRGSMTVRCEVCRKCFEDDSELAAHTSTHTQDEREGRCQICSTTFPRYEQLRRHVSTAHSTPTNTSTHTCDTCGKTFTHAHSLTRHLHNHARQLYRCVVCKASFARAEQLAQHLNSHLANYKRLKS